MLNQADFNIYHEENPQVYEAFKKFTFQAIAKGRKYFSSEMVINRLRWYTQVESNSDIFKINNNYKAFYSRKFEEDFPKYKGFFRKRRSVANKGE